MAESQARQSMSAFGGLIAGFLVRVQVEEFLKAGFDPAFFVFCAVKRMTWSMFTVYVLRSTKSGKQYIGQTSELARRLSEHNESQINVRKYTTRNTGPWVLVYSEEYLTRAEAMAREKWLKSGVGREWLKVKLGRACPPSAD